MNKALHNLHTWRAGNEKANQREDGDVKLFNGQTLRGMECMPPFSYSKALCRSSLLLSDFCTLALGLLSLTTSYNFSQTICLILWQRTHGFTHSQCTSLQSKEREHSTLKMVELVSVLYPQQGTMASERTFLKSLQFTSTYYKKTFNHQTPIYNFHSVFVENKKRGDHWKDYCTFIHEFIHLSQIWKLHFWAHCFSKGILRTCLLGIFKGV